ncbi:hypothetical protein V1507DRAFT_477159 [Lipomyces tetrasporus]
MEDLLDLSFTSQSTSQPSKPGTTTTTPLPVFKAVTSVSSRPSSASTSSSQTFSPDIARNGAVIVPKKTAEDSFASLVSFSTAKKQSAANKRLNEREKARDQLFNPPPVNTKDADWASGLSFDVLDSSNKDTDQTTWLPSFSAAPISPTVTNSEYVNLLDDEDILGPLAKAVPQSAPLSAKATPPPQLSNPASPPSSIASPAISSDRSTPLPQGGKPFEPDPRGPYVSELVEMGFSVDHARRALAMTDDGLNVQQAVDILLQEAHEKAKLVQRQRRQQQSSQNRLSASPFSERALDDVLAPHPDDRRRRGQQFVEDTDNKSFEDNEEWQEMPSVYSDGTTSINVSKPPLGFKIPQLSGQNTAQDLGRLASGFSSQLRSRAEVLWKQGKNRVARAVEEYNNAGGLSGALAEENPRWMRNQHRYRYDHDAQEVDLESPMPEDRSHGRRDVAATLEAKLMEQENPYRRPTPSPPPKPARPASALSQPGSLVMPLRQSSFRHEAPRGPEQPSINAHTMPSRQPVSSTFTSRASAWPVQAPRPPSPKRPPRPKRSKVDISSVQMDEITILRIQGTEAFKRGDFTQANESYSKSLNLTPSPHLLRTVLLSNRAACLLKLGNIKSALTDAEEGLTIIGATRGVDEEYESGKNLVEIWAKLLQRKSEALEQLERFREARDAWEELVQTGKGGKVAIDGKRRCESILNPKPKSASPSAAGSASSTPKPASPAEPSATSRKSTSVENSVAAQVALKRLQKMNDEAEAQDAEKFALHDTVEQKLAAWRSGKEDNIRALIGSLDTILWPEARWTKVSMADLVIPKKVKINYMKAVAKTHPDKVAASSTTEQKMIAQGVFVSLNRAWDEFKKLNNMQ